MSFETELSSKPADGTPSTLGGDVLEGEIGVGLLPTDASQDAIARALLRAELTDYQPLLVITDSVDQDTIQLAEKFGVPVIDPSNRRNKPTDYHALLEGVAQTVGMEQLIVYESITDPIDYGRTERIRGETDSFTVSAVTESVPEATRSVVAAIPAYNEAETITQVVKETDPYVDRVVVVDDGSDDDTATVADRAGATVIEHETNNGYGAALNTAFKTAAEWNVDRLVVLDGDGQHEPADIPRLLERLEETESEIAIGSRLAENGDTDIPVYRRAGLGVVNVLTNLSMGILKRDQWVKDTQSGFRAYDRPAIESLAADPSIGSDMDASTDILYHGYKQEYDIEEVGTTIYYDVENGSSQHPVSHGFRLVHNILNTVERERPVAFVGVPGFILAIIGVTLGYFALSNFLATGSFPLGMALGSSVVFLTGLFLGLIATVLHALKQYLENSHAYRHETEFGYE